MNPATVFLGGMCTIFFFLWLYSKTRKNPDSEEEIKSEPKEEYKNECRQEQSIYSRDYSKEYPKIIECKRKGEEGGILLIRYPGDIGEKIRGRRREDSYKKYNI